MATLYDLLNADQTEVEAQRVIRAPGATAGDVLTVQADGTIDPAPGGGSQPATYESFGGNGISINDGDGAWLPWSGSGGPDTLLDLSVPAHPTVIAAGDYTVSVVVQPSDLSTEGYYKAGLHMDRTGFNASAYAASSQAGQFDLATTGRVSDVPLSFPWYIPAGGEIGVFVENHDGAQAANFTLLYANIQRRP